MSYSIKEHKHRFSLWAARSAASVNGCRFNIYQARKIIETSGLNNLLEDPSKLPFPNDIDKYHREWRNSVISVAEELGLTFTHGVAAKLINIYLKAGFVCGGHHEHVKVKALHPPIDRFLLKELSSKKIGGYQSNWGQAIRLGWTKLNSQDYESLILCIRAVVNNHGLWEIEQYWQPGYQR